jgi:hypothetical protein
MWAQGTPAPQTQTTPAPQQGTRFTTSIDFVSQDVTPRDSKTLQFLPDLKREDFTLLEDGVEQKIESFALSHGGRMLSDIRLPPSRRRPASFCRPCVRLPTHRAASSLSLLTTCILSSS